jgi:hypothetical protein
MFKKNWKEFFLALTTAILTVLFSLILIEIYYWDYSKECEICRFNPQLGWETIPDKTVSNKKITYTTNSMGMRSEKVSPSKGHILITGDSVAFGLGVNNDETVSHYLEQDERISKLEYQVLNMSVPGYGIGQYYLNLKRHVPKLNPKLIVVIIYTANDLEDTRKDNHYGISKPFFAYQKDNLTNLQPRISRFSCHNLHSRSTFVKYLIGTCQSRVIDRGFASPTITKLMNEIRTLGVKRNIPTLVVLSPSLKAVEAVACEQEKLSDTCHEHDSSFAVLYTYFYKIMEFNKIPHIDFLTTLLKYSKEGTIGSLFGNNGKDVHHYSPKGNYLLAQTIAKRLATDFNLNNSEPFSLK